MGANKQFGKEHEKERFNRRKYALIKKKMQELSHDDFVRWEERMKELAWRRSAIGRKHIQLMHEHELLVSSMNASFVSSMNASFGKLENETN